MPKEEKIEKITEHLFREAYQEVFSSLVIHFGRRHIDLVEDALQESFYKALKSWKYNNYPNNPKGWLFSVTKNHIINTLKREAKLMSLEDNIIEIENVSIKINEDAQLLLLLSCAKLEIPLKSKMVFTLKAICGFGITEIANGLLISNDNIYKSLQRGKQKLQQLPKKYFLDEMPPKFSGQDVSYIEMIIYFMFNEGYDAVSQVSEVAINKEICFEAVRLAHLLAKQSEKESIKHLLALCYFHMSRFDSRINEVGAFVSLRTQDRTKWDSSFISLGWRYLKKPKKINRYYLEALIASIHLSAKAFSDTNWKGILSLYDMLLLLNDSPVICLNRAICMFELGKTDQALAEFHKIKDILENDYLYYSVSMAEYLEDKDIELAKFWYIKSLENTGQDFRKQLIKSKLKKLL